MVRRLSPAPAVGLICLQGPILPASASRGGGGPLLANAGRPCVTLEAARSAIRAARDDPSIRAVVLRIDSGGGDALVSDAIRREVELLTAQGKPVVASLGSMAASGGYLIASAADRIVAQPATLTGSIGALTGVVDATRFLRQQRVQVTTAAAGATPLTNTATLTRQQRKELQRIAHAAARSFEDHVANGRGMSRRAVHRAAQGRVWTGEQAVRLGLVDEIGGVQDACRIASDQTGLGSSQRLCELDRSPWAQARSSLAALLRAGSAAASVACVAEAPGAAVASLATSAVASEEPAWGGVVVLFAESLPPL